MPLYKQNNAAELAQSRRRRDAGHGRADKSHGHAN